MSPRGILGLLYFVNTRFSPHGDRGATIRNPTRDYPEYSLQHDRSNTIRQFHDQGDQWRDVVVNLLVLD